MSNFAANDLYRLVEVMDEFYQEYQDNTSDNRPAVKLGLEAAKPQAFNKVLEEIKCVNKLEIKNRKHLDIFKIS